MKCEDCEYYLDCPLLNGTPSAFLPEGENPTSGVLSDEELDIQKKIRSNAVNRQPENKKSSNKPEEYPAQDLVESIKKLSEKLDQATVLSLNLEHLSESITSSLSKTQINKELSDLSASTKRLNDKITANSTDLRQEFERLSRKILDTQKLIKESQSQTASDINTSSGHFIDSISRLNNEIFQHRCKLDADTKTTDAAISCIEGTVSRELDLSKSLIETSKTILDSLESVKNEIGKLQKQVNKLKSDANPESGKILYLLTEIEKQLSKQHSAPAVSTPAPTTNQQPLEQKVILNRLDSLGEEITRTTTQLELLATTIASNNETSSIKASPKELDEEKKRLKVRTMALALGAFVFGVWIGIAIL